MNNEEKIRAEFETYALTQEIDLTMQDSIRLPYKDRETNNAYRDYSAGYKAALVTRSDVIQELVEALKLLAPFEVVQGDVIHRINPSSMQVVNSNGAWAVSNGDIKSAHKVRAAINVINEALAKYKGEKHDQ